MGSGAEDREDRIDCLIDLRGVRCPLNWAKAKVKLEGVSRGTVLAFKIDDPRGVKDIPRAAEAEGFQVIDICQENSAWLITIEK